LTAPIFVSDTDAAKNVPPPWLPAAESSWPSRRQSLPPSPGSAADPSRSSRAANGDSRSLGPGGFHFPRKPVSGRPWQEGPAGRLDLRGPKLTPARPPAFPQGPLHHDLVPSHRLWHPSAPFNLAVPGSSGNAPLLLIGDQPGPQKHPPPNNKTLIRNRPTRGRPPG